MKRFSIGYRTIKTAVGTAIAIGLAHLLHLEFFTSAGILTILCIQSTKRRSVHAVYTRFLASIIGMVFAFAFFELLGYNPIVLGVMILVFIPTLVSFRVTDGFVSSVVIILHILSKGQITVPLLVNELGLMLIGFGTGLAVNMYMPDIQHKLDRYRVEIEDLYSTIFVEIGKYLKNGDTSWDGKELVQASDVLNRAKALAYQDVENHLMRRENLYYVYFDMREQQLEIIERVLPKITTLPVMVSQSTLVADFMEDLAQNVHSGNTASRYRAKLDEVKSDFAKLPLPDNHQRFIAMAALYQFIEEMDHYLAIKQQFKGLQVKNKNHSRNRRIHAN